MLEFSCMCAPTLLETAYKHFHIKAEEFPRHFVQECLRDRPMWLAPLCWMLSPHCYRLDYQAAELIGEARTVEEVGTLLDQFSHDNSVRSGWVQRWFRFGLSRRKVKTYTYRVLGG